MKLKERAAKLKTEIPALFLALQDAETPRRAKVLAWITVAYALSPIDLIPDFVPVLGYLDDLLLLPALAAWTIRLIPPHVMARSRTAAAGLWADGKPKKWYYALPIAAVWLVIILILLKVILQ